MISYILLGIVQGLTEFLPISSSAHLVLAQEILGVDPPGLLLEAVLHKGTSLAVLVLFRRDLYLLLQGLVMRRMDRERRYIILLAIATIPIVIAGLLAEEAVERAFASILLVGIALLLTGGMLFIADWAQRRTHRSTITGIDSLAIGVAQATALVPGISRSGVTISIGLLRGIRAMEAARFSFLLSLPAILGASGFKLHRALSDNANIPWQELIIGGAVAAVVGIVAIKFLLALLMRGKLKAFGIYCIAVGLTAILHSLLR
ncbi:undecaprenyl-diphosphate phosphatase [Candidatus Acetothermia bacterium]|jgi:undecaprenyl-diphosphatase|nr:undecaprenyl-diphosphate phosphatase [Candidatus Acetothermia bacterium]MCI2426044.1 undecaprenyl-diphosphate phosphatase [Candidatus Acetothermia bacterium]MCI2427301.1 undecaprenyl-diphosphate phosphatase [Candidatus Acetothermia bacterium]MCI2428079.1 undecaprenyl-diphosphate phosphatase [Candidatus Acetothermia bacterium]